MLNDVLDGMKTVLLAFCEGSAFWAKDGLAQARWVRLGEDSQSAHNASVSSLAQARMPSLGEIIEVT
ncbi:hypothetical protein DEO72_LG11g1786 [Vigna unguiculata]|uniref:Uncharacterized protein n=1 Tax=Vigna unguiculata TaxID=3917 RepID=A0A4D6NLT8_VIGUN|nr:hypothetical protein DEO72_LG11g1786 [Vigna unguiculata]